MKILVHFLCFTFLSFYIYPSLHLFLLPRKRTAQVCPSKAGPRRGSFVATLLLLSWA